MRKIKKTPLAAAMGAVVVSAFTATTAHAEANPFAMTELSEGYMQVAEANKGYTVVPAAKSAKEASCGEGKCGATMDGDKMKKGMEGKCDEMKKGKEGACGMKKAAEGKCGEGKCGEGKCAANKKAADGKYHEGKCGEGKCASMMDGDKMKKGMEGACGEMMKGKEASCGTMISPEKAAE